MYSTKPKQFQNLLILYIVKNKAILDINLCSIKLPELCEFDPKKIYLQNNNDFFVYKVEYAQLFSFS